MFLDLLAEAEQIEARGSTLGHRRDESIDELERGGFGVFAPLVRKPVAPPEDGFL